MKKVRFFWISAYKALSLLMIPLWRAIGTWRKIKGKEDPDHFCERFGVCKVPRPEGLLVWLHGASIGEARSALTLIAPLRAYCPGIHILLTVQTRNALRALSGYLPSDVTLHMVPYDCPLYVKRFLDHWRPNAFCVVEAECWPWLWSMANDRAIPLFLFNFHMSEKSFRLWSWVLSLFAALYAPFQWRSTSCLASAAFFHRLTSSFSMRFMPSLKYAAPPLTVQEDKVRRLSASLTRPFWFASCIHEAEEDLILETHRALRTQWADLLLFCAPRHLDRVAYLKQKAATHSWTTQDHSHGHPLDERTSVYLIDTFGELGTFYSFCPFVVLGGSFCTVGGHNLIEPTVLGCAVIHGPDASNARDVAKEFEVCHGALQVGPDALAETIAVLIKDPSQAKKIVQKGQELVADKKREVEQIVDEFSCYLVSAMHFDERDSAQKVPPRSLHTHKT